MQMLQLPLEQHYQLAAHPRSEGTLLRQPRPTGRVVFVCATVSDRPAALHFHSVPIMRSLLILGNLLLLIWAFGVWARDGRAYFMRGWVHVPFVTGVIVLLMALGLVLRG